jgi:hypothetical protein
MRRAALDGRTCFWTGVVFAIAGVLCVSEPAAAGFVSITAGFNEYSGAVGNGIGTSPDLIATSTMQGVAIAPTEPIPGLESAFIPPDPNDPNSVGQGIGRATVSLGGASSVDFQTTFVNTNDGSQIIGVDNLVAFDPGPGANVAVGDEFLLGTFTLKNGEWWAASPIHEFTLAMLTHSSDAALNGHVFSDTLVLNIVPNASNVSPEDRADIFYFAGRPDLGSMRVLEGSDGDNIGTVDLYGKIGSLIPTRFANPTGGLFLDSSINPNPPTSPVPAPSTITMLAALALSMACARSIRLRR